MRPDFIQELLKKNVKKLVRYTDRSTSYLDLHIEVDSEGRLITNLYDKRDDFNFSIVNFPFLYSNISAAPAHGIYIYIY